MVRLLSFLSLLFAITANAGVVPSGVPSVGLGAIGATTSPVMHTTLDQLESTATRQVFSLYVGGVQSSGEYSPLYKNGTAYQVPAGKTAHCFNFRGSSATAGSAYQIVSDTAAISFSQNTALTSGLFQGGASTQYILATGSTANQLGAAPGIFSIAAERYAGVEFAVSESYKISMDCFEE